MGRIFSLTDDIKTVAIKAFSDLIDSLGKPCKLVYPPKMIACANCILDPVGHKSTNRWLRGGPVQFPMGSICPMCGGQGTIAQEAFDNVNLLINQDMYKFDNIGIKYLNLPDGIIQTKGYIQDMPKVIKCDYCIMNTAIQAYRIYKYRLFGEPISPQNITQNIFFVALWQRFN